MFLIKRYSMKEKVYDFIAIADNENNARKYLKHYFLNKDEVLTLINLGSVLSLGWLYEIEFTPLVDDKFLIATGISEF